MLDLKYLASLGIRDVYVYHPRDFAASDWAAMRPQVPAGLRLFAGTELVGFAAAGLFDGFYTYDFMNYGGGKFVRLCNQAHAVHLLCAPSVGPGYDGVRAGEAVVLSAQSSRRNGTTYDNLWTAALAAKPDMVTITSYNEWGEGTQIEAAAAHTRLQELRRRLGPRRHRRRRRVPDAHGVLDRALPLRPVGRGRRPVESSGMATRAVPAPLAQLPNALTLGRLALIPVFVVFMVQAGDAHTLARRASSGSSPASPTRSTASSPAAGTSSRGSGRSPTRSPTG